ncbi:MAG: pyridoxamine 5'-phosphate oxidase family protein [Nitrosopumilus sp.]|nr:pyridoxamine 5'-phosphate oxidase family protein [Nitrosopumilus sp.]NRA06268.1 pyridoxamine 5'-phosphate oxidase family protein [Nitrosopumilus sp.]
MIKFDQNEKDFLKSSEAARISTSHDDIPHVKPVSFLYENNSIIIATDYKTRTLSNIKSNPNTSIVIDIYKPGDHKAICIQGKSEIIENGAEFKKFYDIFYKKFEWVRKNPWNENEAPFLKIRPTNKISWGIK